MAFYLEIKSEIYRSIRIHKFPRESSKYFFIAHSLMMDGAINEYYFPRKKHGFVMPRKLGAFFVKNCGARFDFRISFLIVFSVRKYNSQVCENSYGDVGDSQTQCN